MGAEVQIVITGHDNPCIAPFRRGGNCLQPHTQRPIGAPGLGGESGIFVMEEGEWQPFAIAPDDIGIVRQIHVDEKEIARGKGFTKKAAGPEDQTDAFVVSAGFRPFPDSGEFENGPQWRFAVEHQIPRCVFPHGAPKGGGAAKNMDSLIAMCKRHAFGCIPDSRENRIPRDVHANGLRPTAMRPRKGRQ